MKEKLSEVKKARNDLAAKIKLEENDSQYLVKQAENTKKIDTDVKMQVIYIEIS